MKKFAIAIVGLTVFFSGCKTIEKSSENFIPDHLTEKFYWSPGINFGFYSHRHYTSPNDDRFKLTFVPKLVIGYQF
jgi:hypothetical protein